MAGGGFFNIKPPSFTYITLWGLESCLNKRLYVVIDVKEGSRSKFNWFSDSHFFGVLFAGLVRLWCLYKWQRLLLPRGYVLLIELLFKLLHLAFFGLHLELPSNFLHFIVHGLKLLLVLILKEGIVN